MKSFHLIALLVTTVSFKSTVTAKHTIDITMFRMLTEENKIETKEFMKYFNLPVSNKSFGYPYPNEMVFPRFTRPSHVIPNGCAWYTKLNKDKSACAAAPCPTDKIEMFTGVTGQKTHYSVSWGTRCPRQYGVKVQATFCCNSTVFGDRFTVSTYNKMVGFNEATADCQWVGRIRNCAEDSVQCPARKWRNEVARAAELFTLDARNDTELTPQFGEPCQRGNRILCCKDSAFRLQQTIDKFLKSDFAYLFPMLLPKKHRYAGMNVKLIFSPGATTPPTKATRPTKSKSTKKKATTTTTVAPVKVPDNEKEGDLETGKEPEVNNPEAGILETETPDDKNTAPEKTEKEGPAPADSQKGKEGPEKDKGKTDPKKEKKEGPEKEKPAETPESNKVKTQEGEAKGGAASSS